MNVRAACLAARPMKVVATMRQFGLSEREQERVWELWGEGTSLRAVARQPGARPEYVRRYVSSTGGVKPVPASSCSWVTPPRSARLGKYWRSSPLVFSLLPRCHGLCGSQKYTCTPLSTVNRTCSAISLP